MQIFPKKITFKQGRRGKWYPAYKWWVRWSRDNDTYPHTPASHPFKQFPVFSSKAAFELFIFLSLLFPNICHIFYDGVKMNV
jgi:hypothetical protein